MSTNCLACDAVGESCPFNTLRFKLYSCFGIAEAYYEIYHSRGTISCFVPNGILWGRMTAGYINKVRKLTWDWDKQKECYDYSYVWGVERARIQLYFGGGNPNTQSIAGIIGTLNCINDNNYASAAVHEIYFK